MNDDQRAAFVTFMAAAISGGADAADATRQAYAAVGAMQRAFDADAKALNRKLKSDLWRSSAISVVIPSLDGKSIQIYVQPADEGNARRLGRLIMDHESLVKGRPHMWRTTSDKWDIQESREEIEMFAGTFEHEIVPPARDGV